MKNIMNKIIALLAAAAIVWSTGFTIVPDEEPIPELPDDGIIIDIGGKEDNNGEGTAEPMKDGDGDLSGREDFSDD